MAGRKKIERPYISIKKTVPCKNRKTHRWVSIDFLTPDKVSKLYREECLQCRLVKYTRISANNIVGYNTDNYNLEDK